MQIIIELICSIFMCSNNFCQIFFPYIKMSKDSSSKCCQNNKKKATKKIFWRRQSERHEVFLKKKT